MSEGVIILIASAEITPYIPIVCTSKDMKM